MRSMRSREGHRHRNARIVGKGTENTEMTGVITIWPKANPPVWIAVVANSGRRDPEKAIMWTAFEEHYD